MMRLSPLLIVVLGATACGKVVTAADAHTGAIDAPFVADQAPGTPDASSPDASPPDAPALGMTFTKANSWNCANSVDCEDVYDFDFAANASVTIKVTNVDGASVARLALFKGTTTSGTNLLNGAAKDICGAQNTDLSAGPVTLSPAHYRLTVGRDWGQSAGAAGNYTVTVTSSTSFAGGSQTGDDVASAEPHC